MDNAVDKTSGLHSARYERKYLLDQDPALIAMFLRRHPAIFQETYPERWINTVYFDTPALRDFQDNMAGVSQRQKTRLRWYHQRSCEAGAVQYERKLKSEFLVRKVVEPVSSVNVDATGFVRGLDDEMSTMPSLRGRRATMANRYRRRYFETAHRSVRATIDADVSFHPVRHTAAGTQIDWKLSEHLPATVLELKYPVEADEDIDEITRFLPGRITAVSKYVYGMRSWNEELRWV